MTPTDLAHTLEQRVVVVLVQPQYSGNIGSVARAMKNMGLAKLVLVDPPAFDPEQARWMAPGAHDILANARIVATLDEALVGCHRAVGATARHRKIRQPVLEPSALARQVLDDPNPRCTAILFGREDHGLDSASIERCEALLRIPTLKHASLNLSQAVLVTAHALFEGARDRGLQATGRMLAGRRPPHATEVIETGTPKDQTVDLTQLEPAVSLLMQLLEDVGYTRNLPPEKVRSTTRQALQRLGLSERQNEALKGMIHRVQWALSHPDLDWKQTSGSSSPSR